MVRTTSNTTVLSDTLPSSFNTPHGDVISVSVTPFDGIQNGTPATATTTVADAPPTVNVSLSPNNPTIVSTLTATATTSDSDGDPVTLTYVWSKNGQVIQTTADTTSLTDTLPILGNAARGDVVTLTVTPNDGIENGTPVTVSQIVIGFPPTVTVTLGPNNPTANQTLTANAIAADLEGNPVTLTYVWSVDGTTIQTTANTPSPIDTLSLAGNVVKGDLITLTVTPNDGQQTGTPATASVTVADSPPVASVRLDPLNPSASQVITATATTSDLDGDPVTLSYIWFDNGTVVQSDLNETSLTDTYDLGSPGHGVSGDLITVEVVPSDGTLYGAGRHRIDQRCRHRPVGHCQSLAGESDDRPDIDRNRDNLRPRQPARHAHLCLDA